MKFKVDSDKKEAVHKKYLRSKKEWKVLSYGILAWMILFDILFGIYGFVLKDTFIIQYVTDSGYGTKNTFLVWTVLVTADIIFLFLWSIQKIVAYRWTGRYISERVNERLSIDEDMIEYSYQNAVNATPGDRVVIKVKDIESISIDEDSSKIEIFGKINQVYYDNYARRKTRGDIDTFEDRNFVLFDYFVPEVIPYVKKG